MGKSPESQRANEARTFEEALSELEGCVRHLDAGDLPLEQALEVFERGVRLQQECQELLDAAERRVVELSADLSATGSDGRPAVKERPIDG